MTPQASVLELKLLGPLEARRGGEPVLLGGAKPRALLADLLVHLGAFVSADRLVDDLWGERPPASAAHAIEVYVSQLRRALDPERAGLLVGRGGGYSLEVNSDWVDAHRFERLLDAGRAALADGDAVRADALLAEGIELWRGPVLADLAYEPFAQNEIARLEEQRVVALEARIEAELALGRTVELVSELEVLVAEHPFRERLRGQLMLALYRSGRQADALAAFGAARRTLVDELGVEPGPELRALESAVLRQDASLMRPVPLESVPRPRAQRKLVTILCAEIANWATLGKSVDPETLGRAIERYLSFSSTTLAEHGGTIEKPASVRALAAFGIPVAHEDDALRAARASLDMRDGLSALNDGLERDLGVRFDVNIGIATGEVVAGETFATGDAVNVAAQLQQAAAFGEIVVCALTRRLLSDAARLEPLGELDLGGKPVPAFRLLEVLALAPSLARRLDAPLVGRADELGWLREAFERAAAERIARAVAVLGPAGIGKSRLAHELGASLGERATLLVGRCLSYGKGITFWPVRMVVRQAAGDESRDAILAALAGADEAEVAADRLSRAFGSGTPAPTDEVVWAFRLLCEVLARQRPVLLVLDDLHWAEPTLLDLVENLVDHSSDAPMLVLCLGREELLEQRPGFLGGRERAQTFALEALAEEDGEALAEALGGEAGLSRETHLRIVEGAEGNPLFLEQLVALALEKGGLGANQPLPATIQALLLARLDRLGPGERAVLERAAVVGRDFARSAVADLLDPAAASTVRRHLDALVSRGFVRRTVSTTAFEDVFRFRHALIQAAVYGATPKAERAQLHERFAGRLETRHNGPTAEIEALLGYHLEQAYRYRSELGPVDEHTLRLAAEAGACLANAGMRVWKGGDARVATNLLGRATALLPESDATRRELLCELGVALVAAGEAARAEEVLQEAVISSVAARDRRVEQRARIELSYVRLLGRPREGADELLDVASEAISVFEEVSDDRALGRAWLLVGFVYGGVRCQHAAWLDGAERALVHHQRSGWPTAASVGQIAAALYYGPTPVSEAIKRYEELERETATDRGAEANVRVFLGGLEAQRGRFDVGRKLVLVAREAYDELGYARLSASHCGAVAADIALLAGDPVAAERALRSSCETLREMHDLSNLATCASELAEALYAQGRYAEAEEWTVKSEADSGQDDLTAQPAWRSVRAKVLARGGALDAAQALAREAVQLAEGTDALNLRAKVELDFAEVLHLAGLPDEVALHATEAMRLYKLKGNAVGRQKASTLLEETVT